MTSRERVRRAIHFERPDMPPLLHGIVGAVRAHDPDWAQSIYNRFPDDFGIEDDNTLPPADKSFFTKGEPFIDSWGCTRQCSMDGLQATVTGHPLADWGRFADYEPPRPECASYEALNARIVKAGHPRYVRLGIGGLFERMQQLRGAVGLFYDLCDEGRTVARDLAEMVFVVIMQSVELICETEADCVYLLDDWGTEEALLISPEMWRDFFKPYYRRIVDTAHAHGKDVWLHSCGCITDIVPDLIELGVDVLHPQMARLMQDERFVRAIDGDLCLETDIDRNFLCVAAPDAVYERTIDTFRKLHRPDGGLVLRGEMGSSVPRANAEAFYRACRDFQEEVQ